MIDPVRGAHRVVRHIRALWPRAGVLLPLPFVAWGLYRLVTHTLRWEELAMTIVAPALAYTNERTKRLFVSIFPIGLLGLTYDTMGYVQDVGVSAARVHDCDLRAIESRLFGRPGWTVHDWLQAHSTNVLDRLCAIPYGTFLFAVVVFAVFLHALTPREAIARFSWTFFAMNILGFVTYHVYPAAPPWYFHAHGCTVVLSARASEGPNLARVDAWMGVRYFGGLYGRSNDVFGSVPSLHVTYPALMAIEGWRWLGPVGRALSIAYALLMCFAAVYLDHHWIVDVVLGLLFCAVSYVAVSLVVARSRRGTYLNVPGPLAEGNSQGDRI
jgi:inositol phosphorylceramide synthase catalytic subunit